MTKSKISYFTTQYVSNSYNVDQDILTAKLSESSLETLKKNLDHM